MHTSSLLLVSATLLLHAATILPLKPVKGINHKLPIDPMENIQPQSIDDCEEELQRPSKRDMNERKLRRRLGLKIDERFLSITEPKHSSGTFVRRISLRGITTSEKTFLRHVIRNETVPKLGKPSLFMEKYMMKWLIHKSDCPVEHMWKDLGFCYWPRWLSVSGICLLLNFWPLESNILTSSAAIRPGAYLAPFREARQLSLYLSPPVLTERYCIPQSFIFIFCH